MFYTPFSVALSLIAWWGLLALSEISISILVHDTRHPPPSSPRRSHTQVGRGSACSCHCNELFVMRLGCWCVTVLITSAAFILVTTHIQPVCHYAPGKASQAGPRLAFQTVNCACPPIPCVWIHSFALYGQWPRVKFWQTNPHVLLRTTHTLVYIGSFHKLILNCFQLETWILWGTHQLVTRCGSGEMLCHLRPLFPLIFIPDWMKRSSKVLFTKLFSQNVFYLVLREP